MPMDDHHRDHLENGRALVGVEHLGEDEEEDQREKIIEEEDGPVPARAACRSILRRARKAFIR